MRSLPVQPRPPRRATSRCWIFASITGFFAPPERFSELSLPHESGEAVSLIERQIDILRERNVTMRKRMNELLQAARMNDEIFAKTRSLNLALLEVDSWPELNEVLATHVLVDFEAILFAHICAALIWPCLRPYSASHEHMPLEHLHSNTSALCISLRREELTQMFPLPIMTTAAALRF